MITPLELVMAYKLQDKEILLLKDDLSWYVTAEGKMLTCLSFEQASMIFDRCIGKEEIN